jgi:catechol 2,3-dioxygenase-like lactoylglutathione lyase family enzyme
MPRRAQKHSTLKSKTKSKAKPAAKAKKASSLRRAAASKTAKRAVAGRRRAAPAVPKSAQHVRPGFTVNDANASIKWYCDVLGFSPKERWEQDGVFQGGSVTQGNIEINLGQDDWKLGRDRKKGQGVRLYITTGADIDAYAASIKARGGTLDHEPVDGWGMRAFGITDPDGYKITFMRPLK